MKRKIMAIVLALLVGTQSVSLAIAAPVVEEEIVEENTSVEAVNEEQAREGTESYPMGDNISVTFEGDVATITGTGKMWDYLRDNWDFSNQHQTPFVNHANIHKIVIEEGVETIGDWFLGNLFSTRKSINEIELPSTLISIGDNTFSNTSINSINLPSGIKTLGNGSFSSTNLMSIDLPSNISQLGNACFSGTSIQSIKVPEKINILPESCFSDCSNLTNIEVSSEITEIGAYCFYECSKLNNIILSDNVSIIGDNAFAGCTNLSQVEMPEEIDYLGEGAFASCYKLEEITIPALRKEQSLWSTFSSCTSLKQVKFASGFNSNIGYSMFSGCTSLSSIVIPEGVQNISRGSFSGCIRLQEITIPNSVIAIDSDAFQNSDRLTRIKGYTGSQAELFAKSNGIEFVSLGGGSVPVPENAVRVGDNVYATKQGDTLTISGSGSTYDCYLYNDDVWNSINTNEVKKIQFQGTSITSLGRYFFAEFGSLEKIKLPEGLQTMENYVFEECTSLQSIEFPSTLKRIPELTMAYDAGKLHSLKEIIITEGIQEVEAYAFEGCIALEKTTLPNSIEIIGDNAFERCSSLKTIGLSDSLKTIGNGAFSGCSVLEEIAMPDLLEILGIGAFSGCRGLKTVNLGNGLSEIKDSTFADCTNLQEVILPNHLIKIKHGAFGDCTSLEKITLPDSLQNIEDYAFVRCSKLTKIGLPTNLSNLGAAAFNGCTSLETITIPEKVTALMGSTFYGCTSLREAIVPKSVKSIESNTFDGCNNLTITGYKDSTADRYSYAHNIPFQSYDYRVVFKNEGRTAKTEYVLSGQNATPPILTKSGYTLSWSGDYRNILEDMEINAVWTSNNTPSGPTNPSQPSSPSTSAKKYTITYVDRGIVVYTQSVEEGKNGEYPYLYRNGYALSWDKQCSNVKTDMTITATWTILTSTDDAYLDAEWMNNGVELTWDELENAARFEIYRKSAKETEFKRIATTANTVFNDLSVEKGMGYYYKLRPVKSIAGKKYYGKESSVKNILIPLSTPSNIKLVKNNDNSTNTKVTMSMTTVKNANGYYLYCYNRSAKKYYLQYKIAGGKVYSYNRSTKKYTSVGKSTLKGTKLSFHFSGVNLKKYSSYSYKVKAYNKIDGFESQTSAPSKKIILKK